MPDRIASFLAGTAFAAATPAPLAGDASSRRYLRVANRTGDRAVVMDSPGIDIGPFIEMTARLRGAGCSAPRILAADAATGLLLLEDLGDDLFARIIPHRAAEAELYTAAVDLIADLQRRDGLAAGLPPYDMDFYLFEIDILLDWYLPAATGAPVSGATRTALRSAMQTALERLSPASPVCVLRDYHAENLIWLPGREGRARVGLLDYQDARAGHPAYDLASLLLDARRDVGAATAAAALTRFAAATGADPDRLAADATLLGLQRNFKILGIFARLCRRDGKPGYLAHLPRVWGHVAAALDHPAAGDLGVLVRDAVPPPDRAVRDRIAACR